ncbi:MAG: thioesterase family protein [Acidaminobacteraceae bacterium]
MDTKLEVGLTHKSEHVVSNSDTAITVGSGSLEVYGTPCMLALMENSAMMAVENLISDDLTTVGTHLDIKHLSATPIGRKVYSIATLKEIDGKKLKFWIEAYDEKVKIGEGFHSRFIVEKEKFMLRINKQ